MRKKDVKQEGRLCKLCGRRLSIYNPTDECFRHSALSLPVDEEEQPSILENDIPGLIKRKERKDSLSENS